MVSMGGADRLPPGDGLLVCLYSIKKEYLYICHDAYLLASSLLPDLDEQKYAFVNTNHLIVVVKEHTK